MGGRVLLILLDTVEDVDATWDGDDARVDEETLVGAYGRSLLDGGPCYEH